MPPDGLWNYSPDRPRLLRDRTPSMSGWLHVITGPMFSGKTDALLRRARRFELMGLWVDGFRPGVDTRTSGMKSRSGGYMHAETVETSTDLAMRIAEMDEGRILFVDEAQFFDDGIVDVVRGAADIGFKVFVAGLDRDFLRRPFGPMGSLLAEADEVTKLVAVCTVCKRDNAVLTQRLVNGNPASKNDPLILVGGMDDDVYEARCREDWEGWVE